MEAIPGQFGASPCYQPRPSAHAVVTFANFVTGQEPSEMGSVIPATFSMADRPPCGGAGRVLEL